MLNATEGLSCTRCIPILNCATYIATTTTATILICQNGRKPERATDHQSWHLISLYI